MTGAPVASIAEKRLERRVTALEEYMDAQVPVTQAEIAEHASRRLAEAQLRYDGLLKHLRQPLLDMLALALLYDDEPAPDYGVALSLIFSDAQFAEFAQRARMAAYVAEEPALAEREAFAALKQPGLLDKMRAALEQEGAPAAQGWTLMGLVHVTIATPRAGAMSHGLTAQARLGARRFRPPAGLDPLAKQFAALGGDGAVQHYLLPLARGNTTTGDNMKAKAKARAGTSSKLRLKKTPMSLYAEPEQVSALNALSERTRIPVQVYLREGIDMVLAKYGRARK